MDREHKDPYEHKDDSPLLDEECSFEQRRHLVKPKTRHFNFVLIAIVFVLCLTNTASMWQLVRLKHQATSVSYSGIETWAPKPRAFEFYSNFSSGDRAVSDAAWGSYKVNGFVAMPREWAADRGLPQGRDMPGDHDKGVYVLDGFHQLHCLMFVRDRMLEFVDGKRPDDKKIKHVGHCLDTLRQGITCRAEDTPLYIPKDVHQTGVGQVFQCRDWNALEQWVIEHSVCYNGVNCK